RTEFLRETLQEEQVRWSFNNERVFAHEQALGKLIAECALKWKKGIPIGAKNIATNLCTLHLRGFVRTLNQNILHCTHREQIVGRNHEWRMRRINHLMIRNQFFIEVP